MAIEFHDKYSVNLQKTDINDQQLLDDSANPFNPPKNRFNSKEKSIYERRTNKENDTICFTEDHKHCMNFTTMY